MTRRPHNLPTKLGAAFTAAEAKRLGVSTRRLLHADVQRMSRGIYARVQDESTAVAHVGVNTDHPADVWRQQQRWSARVFSSLMSEQLFFSGRTAAALLELPVPPGDSDDLEIACFAPACPPRRAGIRGRKIRPGYASVIKVKSAWVTSPASTWAMLGAELALDDAVALGDAVLREQRIPGTRRLKQPPLATIADLERLAWLPNRRGAVHLRRILPLLSSHSASPPESHLRLRLRGWNVPSPKLDFDVYDERGRLAGCSEFAYPEFRLALEYEGQHHRVQNAQWNRDIEKYRRYAQLGWEVVRVTSDLLYRWPDELRRQIFEALVRRGYRSST